MSFDKNELLPQRFTSIVDLSEWCRKYQQYGPLHHPPVRRINVGIYQIHQGQKWPCAGPVAWQSYCSAAMHFIMAAEGADLPLYSLMPVTLEEIDDCAFDVGLLFDNFCIASQQLIYKSAAGSASRSSRYSSTKLLRSLATLALHCLSLSPRDYRAIGIESEQRILIGDLVGRTR